MGKYAIFYLLENPRRGMQARHFTTNVPKILDLKSSSEQIFSRKLSLGAPEEYYWPTIYRTGAAVVSTITTLIYGGILVGIWTQISP